MEITRLPGNGITDCANLITGSDIGNRGDEGRRAVLPEGAKGDALKLLSSLPLLRFTQEDEPRLNLTISATMRSK